MGAVLEGHPLTENADKTNLSLSGYANDDFIRTWEQLFPKCEKPLEETPVNSNNPYKKKKKERTPMASSSDGKPLHL